MAIPKSNEAKPSTCFSGLLRRLLCSGGLPTHPSDHLMESNDIKPEAQVIMPGVVARLMGLESFPRNRTLGSYLKSRSVNSIDFSNQLDPTIHYHHRRVRTSVDQDYGFVLPKLNDQSEELVIKNKLVKVHKDKGIKSQFNDKLQQATNVHMNCMLGNAACKNEKTKMNFRQLNALTATRPKYVKNSTQNFHSDRHNVHSKSETSRLKPSRKPMSPQIMDARSLHSDDRVNYKRMAETICSLTKQDIKENWKQGSLGEFEEICQQFGQEILQVMLIQIVDQLLHYNLQAN